MGAHRVIFAVGIDLDDIVPGGDARAAGRRACYEAAEAHRQLLAQRLGVDPQDINLSYAYPPPPQEPGGPSYPPYDPQEEFHRRQIEGMYDDPVGMS